MTVSAEELYGTAIPYLVSVDSSQDIQSPEFSSTKIYSALRIKKEFGMNGEGKAFDGSENLGQTAWMVKKTNLRRLVQHRTRNRQWMRMH